MDTVQKIDSLAVLRASNPRARPQELAIYADAFDSYLEAMIDISQNGNIVAHPRTAEPINNPYLGVRDRSVRVMRTSKGVNSEKLWVEYERLMAKVR